jgi:phospholipase C
MGEGPGIGSVKRRRDRRRIRIYTAIAAAAVLGTSAVVGVTVASASTSGFTPGSVPVPATAAASSYRLVAPTSTPIKHVVVLFDENESFDHYFGTYPNAANTDGSTFHAKPGTPKVNGLTPTLLTHNPSGVEPQRLSHSEALTCDQNHSYLPEQKADDLGKMDMFEQNTASDTCTGQPIEFGEPGLVMDYYDGNTVTALWNYAQNYAMSDNNYDTNFGPSTPGTSSRATTAAARRSARPRARSSQTRTAWARWTPTASARSSATSTRPSMTARTPTTRRATRSAS